MNQTELLKHQAAQDQAQIHNLQLRLANAVARAERAEEELKALAEQEPVMCNAALGNGDGTYSSHFLKWPLKAYEKPIHPVSEFFYARPIPAHPSQPGAVGDATSPIPPEWIAAVTAARDQFLKYAELHLAKGTQDGNEKARANQHNADILTKLLERAK